MLKIPLALAASAGVYWMLSSFLKTMTTLPAGLVFGRTPVDRANGWAHAAYWPAILGTALGSLYPIVVLVAFRTRAVRDFYRQAR